MAAFARCLVALSLLVLSAGVAEAASTPTPTVTPTPRASATPARAATVSPTPVPTASRPPPTFAPAAPPRPALTSLPVPTPVSTPTAVPTPTLVPAAPAVLPSPRPTRPTSPPPAPELAFETQVIGYSRQGRPILAYRLGAGRRLGLVIGGIHAGTEANTADLVQQLLERARDVPDLLPPDLTLEWLPVANPDGLLNGTRFLSTGVDPNRNWPTLDWSPDTYASSPRGPELIEGGGGDVPLSEPETIALASLCLQLRPTALVSYHAAADLVTGGPAAHALDLDRVYARAAGYGLGDWTAYPVTGDFAQWAEDQGIPTVEVELPDHASTDLEANWAGLLTLLWAAFP
jgi:murein peptide amidase A